MVNSICFVVILIVVVVAMLKAFKLGVEFGTKNHEILIDNSTKDYKKVTEEVEEVEEKEKIEPSFQNISKDIIDEWINGPKQGGEE